MKWNENARARNRGTTTKTKAWVAHKPANSKDPYSTENLKIKKEKEKGRDERANQQLNQINRSVSYRILSLHTQTQELNQSENSGLKRRGCAKSGKSRKSGPTHPFFSRSKLQFQHSHSGVLNWIQIDLGGLGRVRIRNGLSAKTIRLLARIPECNKPTRSFLSPFFWSKMKEQSR